MAHKHILITYDPQTCNDGGPDEDGADYDLYGYLLTSSPALKGGDSYGAQETLPESLRWVPAAGGITAPLTSQAIRAYLRTGGTSAASCPSSITFHARRPAARMFFAA